MVGGGFSMWGSCASREVAWRACWRWWVRGVWMLLYVSHVCMWYGAGQVRGGIAWACGSGVGL